MEISWQSIIIGFIIGIAATLAGNWIWKIVTAKKLKGNEYYLTYSTASMRYELEGDDYLNVDITRVISSLGSNLEANTIIKDDKKSNSKK